MRTAFICIGGFTIGMNLERLGVYAVGVFGLFVALILLTKGGRP